MFVLVIQSSICLLSSFKLVQLYLYAQYNGKNARVVFNNEPSTSLRYDCGRGLDRNHTDLSDKLSFHLFSGFCLLIPIGLLLLFFILIYTCRPKIHHLFVYTSPESSINQNYAAMILTGIAFSVYVLICDGLAVKSALDYVEENDIYQSDRKPYIIAIFAIDIVSVLIALINIFVLACNKRRTKFMMYYACCFFRVCFCRRLKYHKIQGIDQYNYTSSKSNENKTEKERNRHENKLHHEKKLWLLMISFVAPLVCIGTHANFVIMAWSSDPDQASAMTMIFIISFIYYFLGFRQVYVMLTSGPCTRKLRRERVSSIEVTTEAAFIPLVTRKSNNHDRLTSSLSMATPFTGDTSMSTTPPAGTLQRSASATDLNAVSEWTDIRHKPKVKWSKINHRSCVPLAHEGEIVSSAKYFNFIVLVGELFFATLILAVIEGLTVAVYFLLPAPVSTVPANVLNILHLTLLIGGGLIAYKLLTFQTPTEQILLKSVLDSYDPNIENQISSQDTAKRVGKILGNLLKKFEN